jgi:dTMP kinase
MLLAFEGGDGAGKSTQARLLGEWLTAKGYAVTLTREPGGTPLGARIRELVLGGTAVDPKTEALLFAADRAQHVETLIRPAMARGDVVVTDRYVDSSIAYQSAGRQMAADEIAQLSGWATGWLRPTLTVVLDVSPELGRARRGTVHDRLEAEPDRFHAAVRERFLELAHGDGGRYLVLDAGLEADQIAERVRERVAELLPTLESPDSPELQQSPGASR